MFVYLCLLFVICLRLGLFSCLDTFGFCCLTLCGLLFDWFCCGCFRIRLCWLLMAFALIVLHVLIN